MTFRDLIKSIERWLATGEGKKEVIDSFIILFAYHSLSDNIPVGTLNNIIKQAGIER